MVSHKKTLERLVAGLNGVLRDGRAIPATAPWRRRATRGKCCEPPKGEPRGQPLATRPGAWSTGRRGSWRPAGKAPRLARLPQSERQRQGVRRAFPDGLIPDAKVEVFLVYISGARPPETGGNKLERAQAAVLAGNRAVSLSPGDKGEVALAGHALACRQDEDAVAGQMNGRRSGEGLGAVLHLAFNREVHRGGRERKGKENQCAGCNDTKRGLP